MPQDNNAFAEYGTLCHELLEDWANGVIPSFELADAYAERFDASIRHCFPPFPRGMGQRYYEAGHAYFSSFDGFGNQYEVIAVEERFELLIHGWSFVGIMDLVLREKDTGSLVVIDHKTMSDATMRKHGKRYTKQLYLYAAAIERKHHVFPNKLMFNLLREGRMTHEAFDMDKMADVLLWVDDVINAVLREDRWEAKPSKYFCDHICSVAAHCPAHRGNRPCM